MSRFAAACISALLLLCGTFPDVCADLRLNQAPQCHEHDAVAPDQADHCLLGNTLLVAGPSMAPVRIAYRLTHDLLRADAAHPSAMVEPPTPPPRIA